jgi:L-2-hydroxyglutarate oxidase LhgO
MHGDEQVHDAIVVGAGVVGLACGAALARRGLSVLVLERNARAGQETTSRNSGVIHAGLYYPPGSLKARLCVEGRDRLYARCAARGIEHRKAGKLVVAVEDSELPALEALYARARENGAGEVALWDARSVRARAPGIRAVAALFSPLTGIVDAHGLVEDLASELRGAGSDLVLRTELVGIERVRDRFRLETRGPGGDDFTVHAAAVINAAGLRADAVSALAGIPVHAHGLEHRFCRGDYFVLSADAPKPPFPLVYPLPVAAGLGIHLTTDLGGQVLAGPDTTWVDAPSYDVDASKAASFARAVARYLPGVEAHHLAPGYAGVRPKLGGPDEPPRDFVVEEATRYGLPGFVQLLGIESPGLTASLAIAEQVADVVTARTATEVD